MTRWQHAGDGLIHVQDGSVVGTILRSHAGEWHAHGCFDEWEDVALGVFPTQAKAKLAVEQWVRGDS